MVAENILPLFTEIEKNNLFCIYSQSNLYNTRSRHLQKKAIQTRFDILKRHFSPVILFCFGLRFRQLLRHCLKHQDHRVSIYILNTNYYCCYYCSMTSLRWTSSHTNLNRFPFSLHPLITFPILKTSL